MDRISDILIRPLEITDAKIIHEAVRESLPQLLAWMPWCHPDYNVTETIDWVRTQREFFLHAIEFEFAIINSAGGILGICGLNQIDPTNRRANLGYWIRSGATGRGIATTAVQLLRDWGFQNTDLVRMEIVIAVENSASRRVADKAGAWMEGIARNRLYLQGTPHDAAIFSFVRPR